jgi:shikimate kinase
MRDSDGKPGPRRPACGHIVLVGSMGVGKSTVGRLVADRLCLPFADNDDLLVESTGQTAESLAEARGLEELHRIEADVLGRALDRPGSSVLTAAASVVTSEAGREALRKASDVVWLRDDLDAVSARVRRSGQAHRPGFDPATLRRIEAERRPLFESVATTVIDVVGDPPETVADRTMRALDR